MRDIAGRFGAPKSAIDRHQKRCIPDVLARQRLVTDQKHAVSFDTILRRTSESLTRLLDACDEQLRDRDNHVACALATRADSIRVVYYEKDAITRKLIRNKGEFPASRCKGA